MMSAIQCVALRAIDIMCASNNACLVRCVRAMMCVIMCGVVCHEILKTAMRIMCAAMRGRMLTTISTNHACYEVSYDECW
jgi:hypothetical protein